jgi:hypothetical protein
VWVPNRYTLRISAEDRERFSNMEGALIRELENAVVEGAKESGYSLVARPEVVFDTDDQLKRGDVEIDAELTEATGPPEAPAASPQSMAGAALVMPDDGKEFRLSGDRSVIGRLAGSEVELQDPGASRRHAEIRRQGDDYVVVDLGSTNGTLLNDSPVKEATLSDGDRITIGRTVLEFRRR